ncbi:hypothetical protein F939_00282 [Acinetobacter radioresistens DSM 6976 = NBRC 102413 = CIP 103788]|uniref:hypothetical protein n=1 Tax=Acinetobacter radioresistens TaxID=40216 RepID=UPI00028D9661|nr:hypothetical protein [Acinetobacter radioresistens]ENV90930.1 hypothetical protein F939_00282 [Acinetobacter radioresistens DSM 6976 = NBRC 102413 = CIP 103788]BBL19703.1 hypothetical protein ACRAD_03740 [Acinetobacter radioresistens DSM 6976 = NBRC 102413 = CIP 103788]
MWKSIRIVVLLLILLVVAINAWRDQNQNWDRPVTVLLHPINADQRSSTQQYIDQLTIDQFKDIQKYLSNAAAPYRIQPVYFYFQLGRPLQQLPPKVPEQAGLIDVILWSLKFRFYAWKNSMSQEGSPSVTLYLNFYDPQFNRILKHSTALEKGRIGSVNLFASSKQAQQNQIVLAHELLHAFGASDKYDLNTGLPLYPQGYADPHLQPLYPQKRAEIMTGHIPLSADKSRMAENLQQTMVSRQTATEIGWLK